jgi:2-C-methyl-D-erythritol 4-phosphate cytidylyltransferase
MRYWLVMPAAGSGRRFGGAKQFVSLDGRTLLELALQPFLEDAQCQGGVIALAPQGDQGTSGGAWPARFEAVAGGDSRARSVCNALAALGRRAGPEDWVLVHDAARPCLSRGDLARLLAVAGRSDHGALLAAPVADTVKQAQPAAAGETPRCAATLSRERLWLAQTPQMFRYAALRAALEQALALGRAPTDEAEAMEWQGQPAQLIEAREANFKVTVAADLILARAVLRSRAEDK